MKTSRAGITPIQVLSTLHESASLRAVTGPSLRPGGFLLTERGLSRCGFTPGARIVDVGCGTGASVSRLRDSFRFNAVGFDLTADLIRADGNAKSLPFAVARAEALPVSDSCCDGVLCECVLSLVPEPERAVKEFSRILRPGGFLILSDIYFPGSVDGNFTCTLPTSACAANPRSRLFMEKLLEDSGFRLVAWEDHSRHLRELAAQMILNGDSGEAFRELFRPPGSGCELTSESSLCRPGYYLLVARRMRKGETSHG